MTVAERAFKDWHPLCVQLVVSLHYSKLPPVLPLIVHRIQAASKSFRPHLLVVSLLLGASKHTLLVINPPKPYPIYSVFAWHWLIVSALSSIICRTESTPRILTRLPSKHAERACKTDTRPHMQPSTKWTSTRGASRFHSLHVQSKLRSLRAV